MATRRAVLLALLSSTWLRWSHGVAAAEATPVASPVGGAPEPIRFPRDDGPHDVRTEWWYYTGHLVTPVTSGSGDRYGFELVFFKGRRGTREGYAAHFAITDNRRGRFRYDQRLVGAEGVWRPGTGFDLTIGGWTMRGANGRDALAAVMPDYAIDLVLAAAKPPAFHDGDGYIGYGDGSSSYYYSRTRLAVTGSLTVDGDRLPVTGQAWMDHQWGDFETYRDGGWDWFGLQLADGRDLMLYLIRDEAGRIVLVDGSMVAADGSLTVLEWGDFEVTATASWTSPATGVTYPAGWTIRVGPDALDLTVTPTLAAQELDTTPTTGVVYWEGEVTIRGSDGRGDVSGLGYVELTGYAGRTAGR